MRTKSEYRRLEQALSEYLQRKLSEVRVLRREIARLQRLQSNADYGEGPANINLDALPSDFQDQLDPDAESLQEGEDADLVIDPDEVLEDLREDDQP